MKRYLVTLSFVVAITWPDIAHSSATRQSLTDQTSRVSCGPYVRTYRLSGPDPHNVGRAVRCVLAAGATSPGGQSVPTIVWYAEGRWQQDAGPHRNLGVAFPTRRSPDLTGYSSDIHGNGEDPYNTFPFTLTLHASKGRWPVPTVIDLTSGWSETWTLVPNVAMTPLLPPKHCGRYYEQYSVTSTGHAGRGLRCVFRIGKVIEMWLGTGSLDGKSYAQLGFLSSKGYGASDLCGPSFGTRCQSLPPGSLKLREATQTKKGKPHTITVTYRSAKGTWTELWQRTS